MAHSRGKNGNSGRRGRKHRKSENHKRCKHDERLKEAQQEHAKRRQLAEWIKPRIASVCKRSEVGIAIERRAELIGGKYPRETYIRKLTSEGMITNCVWQIDGIEVRRVTPWHELSSFVLKLVKEGNWKPLWPKSILDRLVDETG